MTNDIRALLQRITAIEGRLTPVMPGSGLNPQQKSVDQLPALFRPKTISPTLTKKPYQKHPMDGKLVGGESARPPIAALDEAMQDVEEDILTKVKKDLEVYLDKLDHHLHQDDGNRKQQTPDLDRLTRKQQIDRDLVLKAKRAVQDPSMLEDPTQQELSVHVPPQPQVNPTLPESPAVKTYAMANGTVIEAHGDKQQGFELRHGQRSLPTRFDSLDHADMAVKLFQRRLANNQISKDYVDER